MIDLVMGQNDTWKIIVKQKEVFSGSSLKAGVILKEMGMDMAEVDFAIKQLFEHGHDVAHFGIYGTFIFSEDSLDMPQIFAKA